jgi:uncharacterized membrane protein
VSDPSREPPDPPAWEILVSHHLPRRYARTFSIHFPRGTVHLCARCSGQALGIVAYVVLFVASRLATSSLFEPLPQLVIALAPLPAALDWVSQSMGGRESTNLVRAVTGAMLGFALSDVLALLAFGKWNLFGAAVIVFALYVGALLLTLLATGAWRRVLGEHFPEVELDAPR